MELECKADFERVLERFEAWWRCEIIDRPPVCIPIRSSRAPAPPQKRHASRREKALDAEYQIDCFEARIEGEVFVAESVPIFLPYAGTGVCSTVFGCELEYGEHSVWSKPRVQSCREVPGIEPNLDNPYWNAVREMTRLSLERGRGKWITGVTDMHTNGDLVADLRDPQQLCLDLVDDIESVRAACDHVTRYFPLMFDDLWKPIEAAGQPCTTWTPALHVGRSYPVSCDFICMISPEMLAETILPSIRAECEFLDRSIFHLDGPGALKHLDALLEIDKLDGVQWVYGAGNAPAAKWTDVYRKVQRAGKCIQAICEDRSDAKALAEHLSPEGVWFCVNEAVSLDEAEQFLRWCADWAAGKRSAR